MKIYIPYISQDYGHFLIQEEIDKNGIGGKITDLGKKRIRKTSPNVKGIPHQAYDVKLFPVSDEYRKYSVPWVQGGKLRRINALCWHGHKNFMVSMFANVSWDIRIQTAMADYVGFGSFSEKFPATKEPFYFGAIDYGHRQFRACKCTHKEMKLAVWEKEDHLYESNPGSHSQWSAFISAIG